MVMSWKKLWKDISASHDDALYVQGCSATPEFMTETIAAYCFLSNRSTDSMKRAPHELGSGTKPTYLGFWIYLSPAFVHEPKQKKRSLKNLSEKCILIENHHANTNGFWPGKQECPWLQRWQVRQILIGSDDAWNKAQPLYIFDSDEDSRRGKHKFLLKPFRSLLAEIESVLRRWLSSRWYLDILRFWSTHDFYRRTSLKVSWIRGEFLVVEEVVYGVFHEDALASFENTAWRTIVKRIDKINSIWSPFPDGGSQFLWIRS